MKINVFLILCVPAFVGCGPEPVPKPHGHLRIDLPEVEHAQWHGGPYSAEVPTYAVMLPKHSGEQEGWFDMTFPGYKASVHLTYRQVEGRLGALIEDAHALKAKHQVKAARIITDRVVRDSVRVYGTLFSVDGDVASPMVFYLTDSTDNFLYGALYFNARPNADSLAPVTDRIREEVKHFAATLRWASYPLRAAP